MHLDFNDSDKASDQGVWENIDVCSQKVSTNFYFIIYRSQVQELLFVGGEMYDICTLPVSDYKLTNIYLLYKWTFSQVVTLYQQGFILSGK